MDRRPIEHDPSQVRGSWEGSHAVHGKPIPCRVKIEWTDGTTSEHNAITKQWTNTHVRVLFRRAADREGINDASIPDLEDMWVLASQCERR
jgi:hypothetical protein